MPYSTSDIPPHQSKGVAFGKRVVTGAVATVVIMVAQALLAPGARAWTPCTTTLGYGWIGYACKNFPYSPAAGYYAISPTPNVNYTKNRMESAIAGYTVTVQRQCPTAKNTWAICGGSAQGVTVVTATYPAARYRMNCYNWMVNRVNPARCDRYTPDL